MGAAHFFDLDTVIISDAKVWIIDKSRPSLPVHRISQSDFNLVRSGVFKSHGNRVPFAGSDYWLSDKLMSEVNVGCKRNRANSSNLAFSLREFMDEDLIRASNHRINEDVLRHLKNSPDDVYFICSKNTKSNYERMIEKVEDKLEEIGIRIKNYYYVSESFYESNDDDVAWDKCRLLLQHLVGVKADGDVFDTQEIIRYEQIHFYDEDQKSVAMVDSIGKALQTMLANSQSSQKDTIRETIKSSMPELIINIVTPNKMKLFSTKKVKLEYANLVKSFESYGRIRK
jgi:hypothetical protein